MKIYLATPYSHDDPTIREKRFLDINRVAARLLREGHHVFSPISHTHPIAMDGDLPLGFDFWEKYDETFIEWCDEVWVYMAKGWEKSAGVRGEEAIAAELGKRIRYLDAEPEQNEGDAK